MPRKHKGKDVKRERCLKIGRKSNGKLIYRSIYGKPRPKASNKTETHKIIMLNGSSKSKTLTFGEILNIWIDNNRVKNKGGTIYKYQNLIDTHIAPSLGRRPIDEIDAYTINSFLRSKLENGRIDGSGGLSPSYVRSMMIVVNSAIKLAVEEGYCSPLKSAILKPSLQKKDYSVLSLSEQKKLESILLKSNGPTGTGILLSLHTGLRIGEICALSWDDIDFEQQIIKVRHTVARVQCNEGTGITTKLIIDCPKTQASAREIPISDMLSNVLKQRFSVSKSEYVVSDSPGFISPRTFEYRYHKTIETAGISKINYHVLRHTFATRCIEAGVDIKSLSEILGHSNVSVTLNTYVHSSLEMKREQLQKLYSFSDGVQ